MNKYINLNSFNLQQEEKDQIDQILNTENLFDESIIKSYQYKVLIIRIIQFLILIVWLYLVGPMFWFETNLYIFFNIKKDYLSLVLVIIIIWVFLIWKIKWMYIKTSEIQNLKEELVNKFLLKISENQWYWIKFSKDSEQYSESLNTLADQKFIISPFSTIITEWDSISVEKKDYSIYWKEIETIGIPSGKNWDKGKPETSNHCYLYKIQFNKELNLKIKFSINNDRNTTNLWYLKANGLSIAFSCLMIVWLIQIILWTIIGEDYINNWIIYWIWIIITVFLYHNVLKLDKDNSYKTNYQEFEKNFDIKTYNDLDVDVNQENWNIKNELLDAILEFNIRRKYDIQSNKNSMYLVKNYLKIIREWHNVFEATSPKSIIKDIIDLYIDIRDINKLATKINSVY